MDAKVSVAGRRLLGAVDEDCSPSEWLSRLIVEESHMAILEVPQRDLIFGSGHQSRISFSLIPQSLRAFAHEVRGENHAASRSTIWRDFVFCGDVGEAGRTSWDIPS